MQIQSDRAFVPAGTNAVRYLTIKITAPEKQQRKDRAGVNVSLVLDRSGSMGAPAAATSAEARGAWRGGGAPRDFLMTKMTMARKAVDHAVRLLDSRDQLGVVVYDNEVDVLLDRTSASPEAKALAAKRLAKVDARGATNLHEGWAKGLALLAGAEPPARVLLLSDGLANEGQTDAVVLAARAAEFRDRGITTSTFGVGADFDETLMSRLATEGGGHFYFIEDAKQIPDFLASELGETLDVVAHDAHLELRCTSDTAIDVLNELKVERFQLKDDESARLVRVRLGDLAAGQEHIIVLAVALGSRADGERVRLECRTLDRDNALFPGVWPVEWTAVPEAANQSQPVNIDVILTAATLRAERFRAAALELNRSGRFDEAKAHLKQGADAILAMAPADARLQSLAAELEAEMDNYAAPMSALEMKNVLYQSVNLRAGRTSEGRARRNS